MSLSLPPWTFEQFQQGTEKEIGVFSDARLDDVGEVSSQALTELAWKCSKSAVSRSALLPEEIQSSICYTVRDDRRNGADRPRSLC